MSSKSESSARASETPRDSDRATEQPAKTTTVEPDTPATPARETSDRTPETAEVETPKPTVTPDPIGDPLLPTPTLTPKAPEVEPTPEPKTVAVVDPVVEPVIEPNVNPVDLPKDEPSEPVIAPTPTRNSEREPNPTQDPTPVVSTPTEPDRTPTEPETAPILTPEPISTPIAEPVTAPTPQPTEVVDAPAPTPTPTPEPISVSKPAIPPTPSLATSDGPERLDATEVSQGETLSVDGGRVTTLKLDLDKDISAVEIIAGPDHGHATVNPDNSIALVLSGSDYSGPLSVGYKVTYTDGTTEASSINMTASAPSHDAGWGLGKHYLLEEDENGELIVETGDNHRKVYVSESEDALSIADIAALEGISESDIDRKWLAAHEEYGGSEDMALQTDLAMDLWFELTSPHYDVPSSHWLMFEKGYTYEGTGRLITNKMDGESELHPVHITSWGEGERPIIMDRVVFGLNDSNNIVFSDLHFQGGVLNQTGADVIFDDSKFSARAMNIQEGERFTLHDSEVAHVVNQAPPGADIWSGNIAGLYSKDVDGWLIEGSSFHHNGWEDGYHDDWSTEGGMPPNIRSHNIYMQYSTTNMTFRDNITAEGSSFGMHARGGGYIENNVFLDNNNAVDFLGGDYAGQGRIGNFTLFADNLVTSGAHKQTDLASGGLTRGVTNGAQDSTLLDNIIAHMANPDDAQENLDKWRANYALENKHDTTFDNTLIYNWIAGSRSQEGAFGVVDDQNTENVDPNKADETTIQRFAAQLLGVEEASIRDLMDYIISLGDSEFDDAVTASDIINYFQAGFGLTTGDEAQTDHRFIPNDLGDGVRWDNRINWDTEDVPDDGDNVALAGNHVQFGDTVSVNNLDLGSSGELDVNYGRLTVDGELSVGAQGGEISTIGAGQFWTDGYSDTDRVTLNVESGRFANTGEFTGTTSLHASGDGQAILATDGATMELSDDSELRITGSDAKVGFDGQDNGVATLKMADDATLSFVADSEGFSTLEEFRSGKWDQDDADVQSGVSLDGKLNIDLTGYAGGTGTHTLINTDVIDGIMDDIHIHGLAGNLNAEVTIDYDADQLLLDISSGQGQISFDTIGNAGEKGDASNALWSALTSGQGTYDDNLPDLHEEDGELSDLAFL